MGASINVCLLIYCLLIVRLEMSVLSMSVRHPGYTQTAPILIPDYFQSEITHISTLERKFQKQYFWSFFNRHPVY